MSNSENYDRLGIFARLFGNGTFEVLWLDGYSVIEMAASEEYFTGDSIPDYLSRQNIESYARDLFSPWGELEGMPLLRRLSLSEAIHYLGRSARVCAFLSSKTNSLRFIDALDRDGGLVEQQMAEEVRYYLDRFDEIESLTLPTVSHPAEAAEEQLLNITTI